MSFLVVLVVYVKDPLDRGLRYKFAGDLIIVVRNRLPVKLIDQFIEGLSYLFQPSPEVSLYQIEQLQNSRQVWPRTDDIVREIVGLGVSLAQTVVFISVYATKAKNGVHLLLYLRSYFNYTLCTLTR